MGELMCFIVFVVLQVLGKGGVHMGAPGGIGSVNVAGLLTDGSKTFGAAGASYSSFYSDTAKNVGGVGVGVGEESGETDVIAVSGDGQTGEEEADTGEGYDPLAGRTRGLGKVFVEFESSEAAVEAQKELSGRAFNGRILVTSFVEEGAWRSGAACDFTAC